MMADDFRQGMQEARRYVSHLLKVKSAQSLVSSSSELEPAD